MLDTIFAVRQQITIRRTTDSLTLHFSDFKSVCDTVWIEILFYMMKCGNCSRIISIPKQLYINNEDAVAVSNVMSDNFKIKIGVKQVCVMSPMLFNIISGLCRKEITVLSPEFKVYADLTTEMKYADDTTVILMSFNRLEIVSNKLKEACSK